MFSRSSVKSSILTRTGCISGAIRWGEQARTIWPRSIPTSGRRWVSPSLRRPSAPPDQLEAFKHVPIIVLQGDQDRLLITTREWVAKMKELGMEHVYVEVKGEDHSRFINASQETLSKLFALRTSGRR